MAELVDVLRVYATDKTKEREGVWTPIKLAEGVEFEVKVAASRTRAYQARLLELMAPYRETLGKGEPMTDEQSDEVFAQAMAGTLLADWRGLTINGEPFDYSEERAVMLLGEIPDFREAIAKLAQSEERFRFDNVEALAERLGERFGGGSKTTSS